MYLHKTNIHENSDYKLPSIKKLYIASYATTYCTHMTWKSVLPVTSATAW